MTTQPGADRIHLDREHAASLARLLRQLDKFLDECDEGVEDALATFSGLNPACEAFSAALCLHADTIESVLAPQSASTSMICCEVESHPALSFQEPT